MTLAARRRALSAGLGERTAFYHVHSYVPVPADEDDVARHRRVRRRVRRRSSARGRDLRRAVPPGEVLAPPGCGSCATSWTCATARPGRVILYPAIDISEGKAVRLRQGDFDAETVYHDDPLEAARAWVDGGRALPARRRPRRRARRGARAACSTSSGSQRELGVPVQYGGGLRSLPAVRDALRAGAERVILGTAAYTDVDFLDDVVAALRRRAWSSPSTPAAALIATAGLDADDADARRGGDRAPAAPRRAPFVYTNVDRDGMLEGPDLDEVRRIAAAVRGRFMYSGGIGALEDLQGAGRACARSTSRA